MAFKVESDFYIDNFRCVVIFVSMGHRCGYVGIPKGNPLYGIDYNKKFENQELLKSLEDSPIGKRGIIPLFCFDGSNISLDVLFDVHGGITYSGGNDNYPIENTDLWWIGFDCAHSNDRKDFESLNDYFPDNYEKMLYDFDYNGVVRTKDYVESECKNLVEQIIEVTRIMEKE